MTKQETEEQLLKWFSPFGLDHQLRVMYINTVVNTQNEIVEVKEALIKIKKLNLSENLNNDKIAELLSFMPYDFSTYTPIEDLINEYNSLGCLNIFVSYKIV